MCTYADELETAKRAVVDKLRSRAAGFSSKLTARQHFARAKCSDGFRFNNPEDQQAFVLQQEILRDGVDAAVVVATGLAKIHLIVRDTQAVYFLLEFAA